MTDFDTIVIGSGCGGLSAALRLSQQAVSVLLLEAMPAFGGFINPFECNGYRFDTGIHYLGKLGPDGSFRQLLKLLEIDDQIDFIELDPNGFDRYIFPDFELRLCKGRQRFKERLKQLFPNESKAIDKFFDLLDRLLKAFSDPHGPPENWLDRLRYICRYPFLMKYHCATYQKMLRDITPNLRLQAALAAHCGNSGLPPERASAFLSMMLLDHYLDGAYYPRGGSAALRDAFVTALQHRKATLKNRSPVTSITRSNDEFIVKVQSGERFSARTIISNVDPLIAFRKIIDPSLIPRATRKKVSRMKPSNGSIYAFIGTSLDPATVGVTDANIIHFEHTDVNQTFKAVDRRPPLAPFPYFFITSPSIKDTSQYHGDSGHHTIEIISGLGAGHPFTPWSGSRSRKRGQQYLALKNKIGMCLVKSAERYLPDLTRHLNYVEFATPLSNEYWVNSFNGGNFGPEQSPRQFGPGRFFDCTTGIEGLFIVGAGAISAGVLSCIASGVWAANQAVEYLQ